MERNQNLERIRPTLLAYQRDEETDHLIYTHLARREKNEANHKILARIAADEKEHAAFWGGYTGEKVGPDRLKVLWYSLCAIIFGYTFVIKLMEKGEYTSNRGYSLLVETLPQVKKLIADEQRHEEELTAMLDEERLKYVGAMVLGLNDALVELSGALAGLTLALADTRLVALTGIVTGGAATLSMAASNYLAEKADGHDDALKSSIYTGVAYLVTVVLLVTPYLLFPSDMYVAALLAMLLMVIVIIFVFNYYVAVAKSLPFTRRFTEMAVISLGVAAISFGIGLVAKWVLGVEI